MLVQLELIRFIHHPHPAATKAGIRLELGQRFCFHNFRHSLATFLVIRGKDVKTIQGLLPHAKVTTTLNLYSQAIDNAKLAAQEEIATAIPSSQITLKSKTRMSVARMSWLPFVIASSASRWPNCMTSSSRTTGVVPPLAREFNESLGQSLLT